MTHRRRVRTPRIAFRPLLDSPPPCPLHIPSRARSDLIHISDAGATRYSGCLSHMHPPTRRDAEPAPDTPADFVRAAHTSSILSRPPTLTIESPAHTAPDRHDTQTMLMKKSVLKKCGSVGEGLSKLTSKPSFSRDAKKEKTNAPTVEAAPSTSEAVSSASCDEAPTRPHNPRPSPPPSSDLPARRHPRSAQLPAAFHTAAAAPCRWPNLSHPAGTSASAGLLVAALVATDWNAMQDHPRPLLPRRSP